MVGAGTTEINAGMRLPAGHFAVRAKFSAPLIYPNLQQSLQQNKTAGLVALEELEADGG